MGRESGSIRERRPGVWQIRVRAGTDPITGKPKRISRTITGTKAQAERALARLIVSVEDAPDAFATRTVTRLDQLLERYLAHLESLGRSPSTLQHYRGNKERLVEQLGNPTLRELCNQPERIDRWRERMTAEGRAPNTVHQHYVLLSGAFKAAYRWGWIDRNPMDRTTRISVRQKRARPPRTEQVASLIDSVKELDPVLFMALRLTAATGVRRGELVALKWGDIEGDAVRVSRSVVAVDGVLHCRDRTKSDKERLLHLDDDTLRYLGAWRVIVADKVGNNGGTFGPDTYILSHHGRHDQPIHPDSLTHSFRRVANRLGMTTTRLHDLRHWHASMLIDNGESIVAVAARLGHDPATSMKTYAHLLREDKRASVIIGRELGKGPDQLLD